MFYEPGCVYVGNVAWPCCAINTGSRASSPGISDHADDLRQAVTWARARPLWLLVPSSREGHWSAENANQLRSPPAIMVGLGCVKIDRVSFDQTLLLANRCG